MSLSRFHVEIRRKGEIPVHCLMKGKSRDSVVESYVDYLSKEEGMSFYPYIKDPIMNIIDISKDTWGEEGPLYCTLYVNRVERSEYASFMDGLQEFLFEGQEPSRKAKASGGGINEEKLIEVQLNFLQSYLSIKKLRSKVDRVKSDWKRSRKDKSFAKELSKRLANAEKSLVDEAKSLSTILETILDRKKGAGEDVHK